MIFVAARKPWNSYGARSVRHLLRPNFYIIIPHCFWDHHYYYYYYYYHYHYYYYYHYHYYYHY